MRGDPVSTGIGMKQATTRLLLVEDDHELAGMIEGFLFENSFAVTWIDNGSEALHFIRGDNYLAIDLVILDIMLPDVNGITLCHHVRRNSKTPVLMLTACDDEMSEIDSLETGADSYLVKPVRPHVLLAHIHSLLRRTGRRQEAHGHRLEVQDIALDLDAMTATVGGHRLELTTAEWQLLEYLIRHPGETISRDRLCRKLLGFEYDGINRSIDMRISSLRRKMGDDNPPFRYVKTIRGKGYRLVC